MRRQRVRGAKIPEEPFPMNRTTSLTLVLACAVAALAGAESSNFSLVWKAPDAGETNFRGRKVAALVLSDVRSVRLGGEDALAKAITAQGAQGVAAYTMVPLGAEKDKERAKELMGKAGVVGIVAMRAVGSEHSVTTGTATGGIYQSDSVYVSFWGGYYNWGWGGVYDPGYLRTTQSSRWRPSSTAWRVTSSSGRGRPRTSIPKGSTPSSASWPTGRRRR